jgi:signal transduction histidine kinase
MGTRLGVSPLGLYLSATLAPAVALGWLGWRITDQERALHDGRVQDRLDHVLERSVAELGQRIMLWDERLLAAASQVISERSLENRDLASDQRTTADPMVMLLLTPSRVEHLAGKALLYFPAASPTVEPVSPVLQRAESLELINHDYASAYMVVSQIRSTPDRSVHASARFLAARNLRKMGRPLEALRIYAELADSPNSLVRGLPADLLARSAQCELLAQLGLREPLLQSAGRLHADLYSGRWRLTHATFDYYRHAAEQWMEDVPPVNPEDHALAQAAAVLWEEWRAKPEGHGSTFGPRTLRTHGQRILALERRFASRTAVLLAGSVLVERDLIGPVIDAARRKNVELRMIWNDEMPTNGTGQHPLVRTVATPGLPWALTAAVLDPALDRAEVAANGRIVLAGLLLLAAIIGTSTFIVARALRQELEVSRLKCDFVAAVSHDFRTPLTAVSQAAELIAENRVSSADQRAYYANLLVDESRKLRRLVDSLLEFARVEGGASRYRLQPVDYGKLLHEAADAFEREAAAKGFRLVTKVPGQPLPGLADRDALLRALMNLLHNAVQYSPGCDTIWLEARVAGRRLAIDVRDEGIGVPRKEQKAIFRKFVRGSNVAGVVHGGAGIGLSIVQHAVREHHGSIRLQSGTGEGSTFTILLPLEG